MRSHFKGVNDAIIYLQFKNKPLIVHPPLKVYETTVTISLNMNYGWNFTKIRETSIYPIKTRGLSINSISPKNMPCQECQYIVPRGLKYKN